MKKEKKNKTLINLKKFNNAFKKELKAKIYSGGGDPTPLSVMNTLIFEDQTQGAPKILLEDEFQEGPEAIVKEKTIEETKEDNIASQIEIINKSWNYGIKKGAKGWLGTTPSKPWTKETFIAHLNKKGVKTDIREIQNYIAEKFSISERDFENKMKEAMYKKRQKDEENLKYIAENSGAVKENINKLFKRTQEIEQAKQEAKRTLKSTPKTKQEPIKKIIKNLNKEKDNLKKKSSQLMEQEEELEKMQAEVTNTSILPNLNELLKAEGKSPFSEEAFNRFNRRIKGEQGNNTNMDSSYEELEERRKERKEDELALMDYDNIPESAKTTRRPISDMRARSPILKSNTVNNSINKKVSFKIDSENDVKGQGGVVSGSSIVSHEDGRGGGEKVIKTSSNEPISVSDDREVVNTASNKSISLPDDGGGGGKVSTLSIPSSEVTTRPRQRKQTEKFDPSPTSKVTQASRSKLTQRSKKITKNRTSNRKASEPAYPFADEDDAMNWEDFDEESEEPEEKSSERKEPKFIEPEVEEAFEFSHTINSENKTIIRNIIKNLNGILSAPILSLSTGSKSDIKHVNNVIIYDEIREGEERLKKMSEDSIYVPKYIPQLPSEQ